MIYIIKRDGRQMPFDTQKIKNAILKSFKAVDG
jgi:anaerobic ribonucleoside-triphosphate reductase